MIAGGRKWVYPLRVAGRFQRLHRVFGVLLQVFLFAVPWARLDGRPAVLFDLPGRRVWLLGHVFTPEDTIFLVLLALLATFGLFFFTALWGRLWCGYACPQTVFLEEWVRPIERFIEGERGARMARDKKPWSAATAWEKGWRKVAKWTAFAMVSAVVSMTFTSWFVDARMLWTGAAELGAYAVTGVLTVGMFLDLAWFREQFCNFLCPYARFQGALMDPGSKVVAYAVELGEPRSTKQAGTPSTGHCIDCKKCVAACPQGIDIREGFQLECISCFNCIDACDGVMSKLGHDGLIQYRPLQPTPLLRPRTAAYGGLLTGLAAAIVILLVTHGDIQATVARAPGTLYTIDPDGWVRNTYMVRVSNQTGHPATVKVSASSLPEGAEILAPPDVLVEPAGDATVPVIVRVPGGNPAPRSLPVRLEVSTGDAQLEIKTTFMSGG